MIDTYQDQISIFIFSLVLAFGIILIILIFNNNERYLNYSFVDTPESSKIISNAPPWYSQPTLMDYMYISKSGNRISPIGDRTIGRPPVTDEKKC